MSELNCQTCGACCSEGARVFDTDRGVPPGMVAPLGHWWEDDILGTRVENGQCVALEGTIGECVSCTIYEDRPAVCRTFEMASNDCLRARAERHLGFTA